jgi:hypothetical protein
VTTPTRSEGADLVITPATADDRDEVLDLAARALKWSEGPNREFFAWKHDDNVFGRSPAWVARADERLVGARILLRWRFEHPDGPVRDAVRAVDTVTDPDFGRRGVFRRLTMHALRELAADDIAFVFNTPNDQSRPGYLKMGWSVVGRPALAFRPRSLRALASSAVKRSAAEKWSLATDVGEHPRDAFADDAAVVDLLAGQPPPRGLRTVRSPDFYRWRYGFDPLHYRVLLAGSAVSDGFVVFRLRKRGGHVEGTVCDVVVPGGRRELRTALLARLADAVDADYLVSVRRAGGSLSSFWFPAPRQGPILCHRAVARGDRPSLGDWELSLGDLELF